MLIDLLFGFLAAYCFGILIRIPKRTLIFAGFLGAISWTITKTLTPYLGSSSATFVGAFTTCVLSFQCAKLLKAPVTCFNIPAIFPLVPGILLYQAITQFINGHFSLGMETLMRTIITTFTISGAIMLADLFHKLRLRISSKAS